MKEADSRKKSQGQNEYFIEIQKWFLIFIFWNLKSENFGEFHRVGAIEGPSRPEIDSKRQENTRWNWLMQWKHSAVKIYTDIVVFDFSSEFSKLVKTLDTVLGIFFKPRSEIQIWEERGFWNFRFEVFPRRRGFRKFCAWVEHRNSRRSRGFNKGS